MMPGAKLATLVWQNTLRNPKQFGLSAFGVVVGIAAFVFFLALSLGIRKVVFEIFPLDVVEVIAPQASFLGQDLSTRITDATVEKIAARTDVKEAVPRMAIAIPSIGHGYFNGNELKFALIGDGISSDYVANERFSDKFRDWEAEIDPATLPTCNASKRCQGLTYCDARDNKCHRRVPIILSRNLLEIYNKQFAVSRGLPVIGGMEEFIAERGGLSKMRIYMDLGDTMVASASGKLRARPRRVEGTLLGLSDKAIDLGITIPIGYVKRWNTEFLSDQSAKEYSKIIVKLNDKNAVAPFGAWVTSSLNLRLEDQEGERFAMIIFIITGLFILISLIIITISAINIAHNFFMQVSERRREIGLLRALGGTKADVRGIVLGEAALLGLVSGVLGVVFAILGGWLVDWAASSYLPDFAFKPETFFHFAPWTIVAGISCSILFCVLGGVLPATKAAQMAPARALAQQ